MHKSRIPKLMFAINVTRAIDIITVSNIYVTIEKIVNESVGRKPLRFIIQKNHRIIPESKTFDNVVLKSLNLVNNIFFARK